MPEQFRWFAYHLIYAHCVVCPTIKRVAVLQGEKVPLCFLVAAVLQIKWGGEEETLLLLELPRTQSMGRLPACWEGQDLQHQEGVGRLEIMGREGGGRCLPAAELKI